MKIIGTNIKKLSLERNDFDKPVKFGRIKNNINIVNVSEKKVSSGKSLTFEFKFETDYELSEPKDKSFGEIEIVGEIIVLMDDKQRKQILKDWKRKEIEPQVMERVLNVALELSQIEAVSSSKKLLLPTPVRLPRFKVSQTGKGA